MLVKDRKEIVIVVTDRLGLLDSVREILFEGTGVNLSELHKMAVLPGRLPECSRKSKTDRKTLSQRICYFCWEEGSRYRRSWLVACCMLETAVRFQSRGAEQERTKW